MAVLAMGGIGASVALAQITIPTVPVVNPGTARDPFTGSVYGSVAYTYNIGQTEVTNAQYAAFLNAVAATDTYSLYHNNMAESFGGITRSGAAGSYTYSTISGRESNPVNYVSFWDAARFANWLHNGQPTGPQTDSTTEYGAYTLTAGGITGNTITRNVGWQWAVTSEDEWYKAAYHQPTSAGGDTDNYWLYPTSSNIVPTSSQANILQVIGTTTPVGSYAANFYGTFDMGGNVYEWNDRRSGANRGLRGGSFPSDTNDLHAGNRLLFNATSHTRTIGFRVSQIPGPSSVALLAIGGLAAARRRRS
jgi:formylglycine-generating enzyme required for sulfatase activity